MRQFHAGQSIRFSVVATLLGSLVDPPALTLTVHPPQGGPDLTPSPVRDGAGSYHADAVIPEAPTSEGYWVARWQASGADPTQTTVREKRFYVRALAF